MNIKCDSYLKISTDNSNIIYNTAYCIAFVNRAHSNELFWAELMNNVAVVIVVLMTENNIY